MCMYRGGAPACLTLLVQRVVHLNVLNHAASYGTTMATCITHQTMWQLMELNHAATYGTE